MPAVENPLKLRWGFRTIGEFLGTDERKAQYLVKSGRLPAAKVGKQWCASEAALTEHLESQLRSCLPQHEERIAEWVSKEWKEPPGGGGSFGLTAGCCLDRSEDSISGNNKADLDRPAKAKLPRDPRAVREAKRLLELEFFHECAGGIAVHASLVQTFASLGDTAGVCYAMRRLFAHARVAHPNYLELRDGADDGAGP